MIKRTFDVVCSAIGLIVLSPVLIAIAVAIKIDSAGPVLFVQERVGANFRPFSMLKFRTMQADVGGPMLSTSDDARITRVGRWLRRTKLDELPQLLNVLKGDMSLVGPRPELALYVEKYPTEFSKVLTVRPGMTDPASLEYRNEGQLLKQAADPEALYVDQLLPAKLALSSAYVSRRSLASDLRIILRTIFGR